LVRAPFPAYQGDDPYVFVCYAHDDSDAVFAELGWLRDRGVNLWHDEGINPGTVWRDELASAIENAALFLYFVSPRSVKSSNCLKEVHFAVDQELSILAIYSEPVTLPRGLRLAILDRQAILKYELERAEYERRTLNAIDRLILSSGGTGVAFVHGEPHPPVASGRIHLGVTNVADHDDRKSLELTRSIARYLSWQGGAYRIHDQSGSSHDEQLIDYCIDVAVQESQEETESSWRVRSLDSGEIIRASRYQEPSNSFALKLERVAEMIGEGALQSIADFELHRLAGRKNVELDYARLMLKAEQLNYLDREQVSDRLAALMHAIELEPSTGLAHASLANLLSWKLINGFSEHPESDAATLDEEARRALRLDPNDPYVLLSIGTTLCRTERHEQGLTLIRRSYEMAPTVRAKDELARSLCFAGQPDEAIALFDEILATMPAGHTFPYARLAVALTQVGRLEDALQYSEMAVLHFPEDYYGWLIHANLLAQLADEGSARKALAEAKRLVPRLRLATAITRTEATYGRTDEQRRHLTGGLRALDEASGRE